MMEMIDWMTLTPLAAASGLAMMARRLQAVEEIYALALYGASLVAGLWGLAIAPEWVRLFLGLLVLCLLTLFKSR